MHWLREQGIAAVVLGDVVDLSVKTCKTNTETIMADQSEAINELATALSKAQGVITNAVKDTDNTFFKSKYATLASVWDACRKPLADNGLAVVQTLTSTDQGQQLITTLAHASGQWMRSYYPVVAVKPDPQGFGSALTYARRYALSAMVGVAPADDDGEAASGRGGNGFDKLDRPHQETRPAPRAVQSVPPPKKVEAKKELPPLPDEITVVPQEIVDLLPLLRPLIAVPLRAMTADDLDLVVGQIKILAPKVHSEHAKKWCQAIEATATHWGREYAVQQ